MDMVVVWNGERDHYLCIPALPPRVASSDEGLLRSRYPVASDTIRKVLEALPLDRDHAITMNNLAAQCDMSYYAVRLVLRRYADQVESARDSMRVQGGRSVYWRKAAS